jgi:hypothetical protein
LTQHRYAQAAAEFDMTVRLRNAIRLAGMQADKAMIASQRRIVGIDGIERKIGSGRQVKHIRTSGFELAAKFVMLCLCGREIRRMQEAQLPPAVGDRRLVPSGGAGRAHQHPLEFPDHGMAIKGVGIANRSLEFTRNLQRLRPPSRFAI